MRDGLPCFEQIDRGVCSSLGKTKTLDMVGCSEIVSRDTGHGGGCLVSWLINTGRTGVPRIDGASNVLAKNKSIEVSAASLRF